MIQPCWHGNGFVQVPLNDRTRLHVWMPEVLPATVNPSMGGVHDHWFSFTSRVLAGEVLHITYGVDWGIGDDLTDVWTAKAGRLEGPQGSCSLTQTGRTWYLAGQSYRLEAGLPHEIVVPHDRITVTIMTKIRVDQDQVPRVFVPRGYRPDDAYDPEKAPPEEVVVAVARRGLDVLKDELARCLQGRPVPPIRRCF